MILSKSRLERLIRQRIGEHAPQVAGRDYVTVTRVGQNFEVGLTLDAREKLDALADPGASYGSATALNLGPAASFPGEGGYGPY